MPRMGDLAATDVYSAFDVPLDQGTNVGWANRMGEILTARPQYDETVQYTTASPLVQITEGDIGRATEAALGGMTVTPKGIRAYHSSPHDFDKFDLARIGTGEGAQVYGHGLYFAENPAVSGQGGQYWNQFSERFKDLPTPEGMATRALVETKADRAAAIAKLSDPKYQAHLKGFLSNSRFKDVDPREALKLLESDKPVGPRTYEVNINADPAHMLDWDKALIDQAAGKRAYEAVHGEPLLPPTVVSGAPDAGKWVRRMQDLKGAEKFTDQLREAGIPGIKYLDQGSRANLQIEPKLLAARSEADDLAKALETYRTSQAQLGKRGQASVASDIEQTARALENKQHNIATLERQLREGTSNYVVFDPGIIDIMKKYGIAGTAPLAMGALAAQDRYQQ